MELKKEEASVDGGEEEDDVAAVVGFGLVSRAKRTGSIFDISRGEWNVPIGSVWGSSRRRSATA
jgi:hypothetical protein